MLLVVPLLVSLSRMSPGIGKHLGGSLVIALESKELRLALQWVFQVGAYRSGGWPTVQHQDALGFLSSGLLLVTLSLDGILCSDADFGPPMPSGQVVVKEDTTFDDVVSAFTHLSLFPRLSFSDE